MNERIKELWKQFQTRKEVETFTEGISDNYEKFAELIIRECADFIDSHEQLDKYGEPLDMVYGNNLLEHFDIKK
jgi:hypothetical protein